MWRALDGHRIKPSSRPPDTSGMPVLDKLLMAFAVALAVHLIVLVIVLSSSLHG